MTPILDCFWVEGSTQYRPLAESSSKSVWGLERQGELSNGLGFGV